GWSFEGWYTKDNYEESSKAVPGATLTEDITLYAKWTKEQDIPVPVEKYSITYVTEHGATPNKVNEATTLPETLPSLSETGWSFEGWFTTAGYTAGTEAVAGSTLTEDITLYAKWEQNFYSITYNTNGKGEQPEAIDKAAHLPEKFPVLTDTAQTFAGWYLDAGFTQKAQEGMVLTEDVTLYAKWVEKTSIVIVEAQGYEEGAYLEWQGLESCVDYAVYYKKTTDSQYKKIDTQLIREYPTYYRADVVGLAAGNYTVKVVPVYDEVEFNAGAAEENVLVSAHDRSGFGFSKNSTFKTASGAYNNDGTLKTNAKVIYVSANNAKTVSCAINGTEVKGIQAILEAKQKGDTTPLAIRLIGLITKNDLDYIASTEEGLQVKGKNAYAEMNLTIEGIGEDATCKGFGFLVRNCGNVEFRNFAIMEQLDDAVSVDTNNCNLWIHHLDLYYGQAGGDSDQAKGDGFIDIKKSQYCSVSYNHFYDSGKSCLVDASKASSGGSDYLTYHHNWFDHSDSRHPRIRNGKNIHVYNNYYDGVSKYGVGVTTCSSAFVEANYFRNVKYPMMIAGQGSDVDPKNAKGTFSGEDGGMIKSYNNKIVEGGTFITQNQSSTDFDAVDVANRNDKVTGYSCKKGGGTYSNFDTDSSIMYDYTPDDVEDVVQIVTSHAGRINGGDFHWTFNNAVEDTNYSVIPELKQAILNYKSTLIRVLGIEGVQSGGNEGGESGNGDNNGSEEEKPSVSTDGIVHNFTTNGKDSTIFSITGNLSTSKGTVSYKGLSLTQCLKLESATKISFTTSQSMTLVLVFVESSATIKIDGNKTTATNGIVTVTLTAGSHEITKADGANLFYIELEKTA
ncbi:hypothetical protein HDR67_03270, partial [bacterium]|nr:hypothetical protein [bacterium]